MIDMLQVIIIIITKTKQRINMKQVKIIVALMAGLFSFASVNAGEMTVTGTMQATYNSQSNSTTGNPLGMNTDLTFTGETEVLNGTAVKWTMGTDGTFAGDAGADHKIVFASPFGDFKIGNSGDSANSIDDITPTAFEEANGSGSGTYSTDFGSGLEGSMSLGYAYKNIMGTGVSYNGTYYPKLDGKTVNEKGVSGDTSGSAKSAESHAINVDAGALVSQLAGLKIDLGYEVSDSTDSPTLHQKEGGTVALNYAYGPLSVGVQKKAYQAAQTAITADQFYKDIVYGVAYAVNDSLALSYNVYESDKNNQPLAVTQETTAYNVAYTVGGLILGFQTASTDNAGYVTAAEDDSKTISIKTAF
jgi:hypothetical protein